MNIEQILQIVIYVILLIFIYLLGHYHGWKDRKKL